MASYTFEVLMTISELVDVEADNYDEAYELAQQEAEGFYACSPDGFSIPWDNIELIDYDIPD